MKRLVAALAAAGLVAGTAAYYAAASPPSTPGHLDCYDGFSETPIPDDGVRLECLPPPTTTTVAPTTTTSTTTTTTAPTTTAAPTTTTQPPQVVHVWSGVTAGSNREPELLPDPSTPPNSTGICFYRNNVFNRCDATPGPYQMYPPVTLVNGDELLAEWTTTTGVQVNSTHIVGGAVPTTTVAPTTIAPTTTTPPATTTTVPPSGAQFVETFDADGGLDRFRYGVWHKHGGYHEVGTPMPDGYSNNSWVGGSWSADHDLACGDVNTQRTLISEFEQDTTGANGWVPTVDFHTDELVYVCRDHVMSSMGDIAGYSVVWFSPDIVFTDVSSVEFTVNLSNLGGRQWWKVGIVSEALFNSWYQTFDSTMMVPGFLISDAVVAGLDNDMYAADRLLVSWSGTASAGSNGAMKIGDTKVPCGFDAGADKVTRHPVSIVDNGDGVTFTVAGSSCTTPGAFPDGPVRVVFYDHNYNPDKDGPVIGHTWHWDSIVVD